MRKPTAVRTAKLNLKPATKLDPKTRRDTISTRTPQYLAAEGRTFEAGSKPDRPEMPLAERLTGWL
jgi:hypothetical protein